MKNGWAKKGDFHFHGQKRKLPLRKAGYLQALLDLGVCKDQICVLDLSFIPFYDFFKKINK